jgi:hypothetical protein
MLAKGEFLFMALNFHDTTEYFGLTRFPIQSHTKGNDSSVISRG